LIRPVATRKAATRAKSWSVAAMVKFSVSIRTETIPSAERDSPPRRALRGVPDDGRRGLKQVDHMLRRKGYRPYDPLRDNPPLRSALEEQNREGPQQHWDLQATGGIGHGRKEAP
jgi:hypothetical protein